VVPRRASRPTPCPWPRSPPAGQAHATTAPSTSTFVHGS
jgi:hypothetical protein